ncbi:MAG: bifunctional riboflavin kinase/FAD synthetase [Deltaproteobacteria bacterium]|nr:bifunctional riboflavin kinase/FAD synthetase [Deltaproteobacteria bacterium]
MKVIENLTSIPPEFLGAYVTIGNFDGVHLGHIPIFEKLLEEARRDDRKALVITFNPHPKAVLHPEIRPFYLITTMEEKIALLEKIGIDGLVLIPFDTSFSQMTAEEFIRDILWNTLRIRKIFIGHDYTFGKNKGGNETFLTDMGKKLGFEVHSIDAVKLDADTVSSTRLRHTILEGNVKLSAQLLGRPYNVSGVVIRGRNRGEALGFPTANIKPDKELLPENGVYAVIVEMEGARHRGVLNIGYNPTFSDDELSIEVFILDFNEKIYGKILNILFIERIRNERRFETPEKLAEQIKKDINRTRKILKPYF